MAHIKSAGMMIALAILAWISGCQDPVKEPKPVVQPDQIEPTIQVVEPAQVEPESDTIKPRIEREFSFTIDYSMSPAEMLRDTGCYRFDKWMLEHLPAAWNRTGKVTVTAALIDMGGVYWRRDEALAAIAELGLTPAPDNAALWTLSKEYPDFPDGKMWNVVDPSTIWTDENGHPRIAYVYGYGADFRRNAGVLHRTVDSWRGYLVLALK